MNYGLIPASVCETLYRESGKFGGRQLLVAAFFLFLRSLCYKSTLILVFDNVSSACCCGSSIFHFKSADLAR